MAYLPSGEQLWRTDGTTVGTKEVSIPQLEDGYQRVGGLTNFNNGRLAYVSNGEVWVTDGTASGTSRIISLRNQSRSISGIALDLSIPGKEYAFLTTTKSLPVGYEIGLIRFDLKTQETTALLAVDDGSTSIQFVGIHLGRLIFTRNDPAHGYELWYSDGTPETTALWFDVNPGPASALPRSFSIDGSSVYFIARAANSESEVWYIRDNSSLPEVVHTAIGEPVSIYSYSVSLNDELHINTGNSIYRLNGSNAIKLPAIAFNTVLPYPVPMLADSKQLYFYDGALSFYDGASVHDVRAFGNLSTFLGSTKNGILFAADDQISGLSIWQSDGTESGTSLVLDPEPGTANSYPTALTNLNGDLAYFTGNIYGFIGGGALLQVSGANQLQVVDSNVGPDFGSQLTIGQGGLQYRTTDRANVQIASWNGSERTVLTNVLTVGVPVAPLVQTNRHRLVFLASYDSLQTPSQLWTIDDEGTLIERPASFGEIYTSGITDVGGRIYFNARDIATGTYQLWRTDGAADGTIPISQLSSQFGEIYVRNSGSLFFAGTSDHTGLVFLDGETDQVTVVPTPDHSFRSYTLIGQLGLDTILLRNSNEIWRTRGTVESTQLVTTVPGSVTYVRTSTAGGPLYFFVNSDSTIPQPSLWKTDGTANGTSLVATLPDYADAYQTHSLTEVRGKLFFAMNNLTTGYSEVWTSDGTQSGTLPLSQNLIIDGGVRFVGYDGGIGFRAATPAVGFELFRIDTTVHVTAPTGLTVSNATTGTQIAWPDVAGAIQYDVWINSLSNPSAASAKMRVNDPQFLVGSDLPNGANRIWVRSLPVIGNPSAWSVAKDFTFGADPVLFSTPPTTTSAHPTFQWTGPSDAFSYEIWLTNRDMKTRVLYSTGLTSTSFHVDQTLTPARYAVWVRATRADSTMTNWSTVNEFDVVLPGIPVTGGIGIQRTSRRTFRWPLVTGATGYNLQVVLAGTPTVVYEANDLKGLWHVSAMDLPGGNYTVRVQAVKGTRPLSAWGTGQTVRILIPPANLRSTDTGFAWDAVPTAVSYTYELRNSLTQAVLYSTTQVGTTFTPPAPLRPGQYTLRVYASFFGSASQWTSLSHEIFQPANVSITSSNAATVDGTPTISWVAVAGAVTYEVVVTQDRYVAPVYDRPGIVGTSHRVDRILSPGTYQIQVRAIFADGSRTHLSAIQRLVIGPAPVVTFVNGILHWNSINGATHYELWVNYQGTPVKPKIVYQPNTLQTSYTLPSALPKGHYQAWVRAVRAESGEQYAGLWSVALNFDIL